MAQWFVRSIIKHRIFFHSILVCVDLYTLDVGKLEEDIIMIEASKTLISNLSRLVNNPELFPDVTFIVEGKPLYAHKAILSVQCDQFYAMFKNGMKESTQTEIIIPGTT